MFDLNRLPSGSYLTSPSFQPLQVKDGHDSPPSVHCQQLVPLGPETSIPGAFKVNTSTPIDIEPTYQAEYVRLCVDLAKDRLLEDLQYDMQKIGHMKTRAQSWPPFDEAAMVQGKPDRQSGNIVRQALRNKKLRHCRSVTI